MKKILGIVSLFVLVFSSPSWSASVIRDGREWLQPNLFVNLSWDEINAVCPTDGSPCAGTLNGTDVTGYIWASFPEIVALTALFGAPPPNVDEAGSVWAPAFLSEFEPTRTQLGSSDILGFSSEVSATDVTGVSQLVDNFAPDVADRNVRVGGPRASGLSPGDGE